MSSFEIYDVKSAHEGSGKRMNDLSGYYYYLIQNNGTQFIETIYSIFIYAALSVIYRPTPKVMLSVNIYGFIQTGTVIDCVERLIFQQQKGIRPNGSSHANVKGYKNMM